MKVLIFTLALLLLACGDPPVKLGGGFGHPTLPTFPMAPPPTAPPGSPGQGGVETAGLVVFGPESLFVRAARSLEMIDNPISPLKKFDSLDIFASTDINRRLLIVAAVPGWDCGGSHVNIQGIRIVAKTPGIVVSGARSGLAPADAFTGWLAEACHINSVIVQFPVGGGRVDLAIDLKAGLPGEADVRTIMEYAGFEGDAFQWSFLSVVSVF